MSELLISQHGQWDEVTPFQIMRIVDENGVLDVYIAESHKENGEVGQFQFDRFFGYTNFDEGDLCTRFNDMEKWPAGGLYVAEESGLLAWVADQSLRKSVPKNLTNYVIVTSDTILDVLAYELPTFTRTSSMRT